MAHSTDHKHHLTLVTPADTDAASDRDDGGPTDPFAARLDHAAPIADVAFSGLGGSVAYEIVTRAAEAKALGTEVQVDIEHLPYVEQYQRLLDEHQPEFLMAEAPVYNPSRYYAGTLDGIMLLDGQRVVFDIKTTDRGPNSEKSRPPYPEVSLQLAAYRRAEWVGVLSEQRYASGKRYYLFNPEVEHQPMPETDGAVCIVVSPEDYMVVPVRTDDEVFRCFIAARECARFSVDVSKRVFGPPITKRHLELVKEAK